MIYCAWENQCQKESQTRTPVFLNMHSAILSRSATGYRRKSITSRVNSGSERGLRPPLPRLPPNLPSPQAPARNVLLVLLHGSGSLWPRRNVGLNTGKRKGTNKFPGGSLRQVSGSSRRRRARSALRYGLLRTLRLESRPLRAARVSSE
jgi:hypothetical protein